MTDRAQHPGPCARARARARGTETERTRNRRTRSAKPARNCQTSGIPGPHIRPAGGALAIFFIAFSDFALLVSASARAAAGGGDFWGSAARGERSAVFGPGWCLGGAGWTVMTARGWPVPHRGWLVGGVGRLIERWRGEGEGEHACRLQEWVWLETLESGSSLRAAADPAR